MYTVYAVRSIVLCLTLFYYWHNGEMIHTLNKGEAPSFSSKMTLVLLSLVQASETRDLDELVQEVPMIVLQAPPYT